MKEVNLREARGHKKIWNYFLRVLKRDDFSDTIADLRKKYKIPPNGIPPLRSDTIPPESWAYAKSLPKFISLIKDTYAICDRHGLSFNQWQLVIWNYVFHNDIQDTPAVLGDQTLCIIADLTGKGKDILEVEKANARIFPLAIRINPYASERDIIDFVRLIYKSHIKPLQEGYAMRDKFKIGRFRKRKQSVEERDDFIYRYRHLSQLEIVTLVKKEFGATMDYPYVGKILSRERKNRQKV